MKQTAEEIVIGTDLTGKTVLITGCNSGIGFETMRVLAKCGARIIGFGRTLEKAQTACEAIGKNFLAVECELSDFNSIQKAIQCINEPIDILIANAGIMWIQEKTLYHDIEAHLFVNHIAHFAIVNGLLNHLTANGKVIVLSSAVHSFVKGNGLDLDDLSWKRKYSPWTAYAHSKLANMLFTKELTNHLKEGQTVNAVHPGIIDSNLWRNSPDDRKKYKLQSVTKGATTSVYLAINNIKETGQYFTNCKLGKRSILAQNEIMAKDLWVKSIEIIEKLKTTPSNMYST
ncbi:MAG: SDR family NAD(P)-dependent oxidoreductase [Flavobacteriales bacterium]|nr:SDR family NAD(P)-dependent oxidoreductase [Flavobacteriales bacterium]